MNKAAREKVVVEFLSPFLSTALAPGFRLRGRDGERVKGGERGRGEREIEMWTGRPRQARQSPPLENGEEGCVFCGEEVRYWRLNNL
jgi:hypothetical protein